MSDYATMQPCPLCERCPSCEGTRRLRCTFCSVPHMVECTACETCGLCQGTHLVTVAARDRWLAENIGPE